MHLFKEKLLEGFRSEHSWLRPFFTSASNNFSHNMQLTILLSAVRSHFYWRFGFIR